MQKDDIRMPESHEIAETVGHPPGTPPGLYDRLKYVAEVLEALNSENLHVEGACLAHRRADRSVHLDALAAETVVGRSEDARIFVEDRRLSRQHFRLQRTDTAWEIEELGSTNGTRVNGEPLRDRRNLSSGDLIEAGTTVFVFVEADQFG